MTICVSSQGPGPAAKAPHSGCTQVGPKVARWDGVLAYRGQSETEQADR